MAKVDRVRELVQPMAASVGADVYDVLLAGGTLTVSLTRQGGIDLDTLADVSRELNRVLDEEDLIKGSYTLEVSSPGLERTLRSPEHFVGAIGSDVTIRTKPGVEGERRIKGVVESADVAAGTVTVHLDDPPADGPTTRTLILDDIERARTVFTWGEPASKGTR